MITDDVTTRLYDRKTLGITELKDRFLDVLDSGLRCAVARMYTADGAFTSQVSVTPTTAQNNRIDISEAAAFSGTDGLGNLIGAAAADPRLQAIAIPPSAGTSFHVGLRAAMVETGLERNPSTGDVEYASIAEEIGFLGTPDAVTVSGSGLHIVVNALTESGYDHSGRAVRVWLKPKQDGGPGPQSVDSSAAFETVEIEFSTPDNHIETAGQLGQVAPSTTAADYIVMLVGPRVTRSAVLDLTSDVGTLFLAAVTSVAAGNPITVISCAGQTVFSDVMSILDQFIEIVGTHPKVRVRSFVGETAVPQITVMGADGATPKFTVDEEGNVECAGDLTVGGAETVEVSEIVTGDVQIGEDSGDTLTVVAEEEHAEGSNISLGAGGAAVPANKLKWTSNGTKTNVEVGVVAGTGNANDLAIRRNDAIGDASAVEIKNASSGGAVGLKVQGNVEIGISPGATGPSIALASSTNTWTAQNVSGGLTVSTNDVTSRTVTITNTHGSGVASLAVEADVSLGGTLKLTGAGAKVQGVSSRLMFADNIVGATGIPLSSSTEAGGDRLVTGAQSLLGGIAEIQTISNNIRQGGVFSLSGLVTTQVSGLVCAVSAGACWIEGKKYVFASATNLTLPANQTNYVYISSIGVLSQTLVKADAFASNTLPLAVVVTGASAITTITTIRPGVPRVTQGSTITVGTYSADNRVCDFSDLTEALDWVKHRQSLIYSQARPEVEILIVGKVILNTTYQLSAEHSGLTIRGIRKGDRKAGIEHYTGFGESILTSNNCTFFSLPSTNGPNDLTIRDLTVISPTTSGDLFLTSAGSACGLTIDRCRFTFTDGGVSNGFLSVIKTTAGALTDCRFTRNDCECDNIGAVSTTVGWLDNLTGGTFANLLCTDNNFAVHTGGTARKTVSLSGSGKFKGNTFSHPGKGSSFVGSWVITENEADYANPGETAIYCSTTRGCIVSNNRLLGFMYAIDIVGSYSTVTGNKAGGSLGTTPIRVNGNKTAVTGNVCGGQVANAGTGSVTGYNALDTDVI